MAAYVQKTLSMVAGAGYVITLPAAAGSVNILARAECFIQTAGATNTAPTAPTVSPAPGNGVTVGWCHMLTNETQGFGSDSAYLGGNPALQDTVSYLLVWAVASGNLVITAH